MNQNKAGSIDEIEKRLKRVLSTGAFAIGVLNMVNHSAIVLALIFVLLGWVIDHYYWIGGLILIFGRSVIKNQVISRIKHVKQLGAFKFEDGELFVYDKHGLRFSSRLIVKIRKKDFLYCDPWRPITIGYPGIEIMLDGQEEAIEHLCAYGMDEDRNEVFDLVQSYMRIQSAPEY